MLGRNDLVKKLNSRGCNIADPIDNLYFCVELIIGVGNYFKFIHAQKIFENMYMLPSKLLFCKTGFCCNANQNCL